MSHPNRSQPSSDTTPIGLSVPVLAYHKIDGGFELGVNSIPPEAFDRQMRFLADQGYTAITVDRFIQAIDSFSARKKTLRSIPSPQASCPRGATSRLKPGKMTVLPPLFPAKSRLVNRRKNLIYRPNPS